MAEIPASHLDKVRVPVASSKVYKDECIYSFQTLESAGGLYISLNNFQAVGPKFIRLNYEQTGSGIYLNVRLIKKEKAEAPIQEPPKKKPSILGIGIEGGFDAASKQEWEEQLSLYLYPEDKHIPLPNPALPDKVQQSIKGVLEARSVSRTEDVKAWVAEKRGQSKYVAGLKQLDNGARIPPTGWKCTDCDKNENLWLNLTDGYIGCGRKNWDGTGGNEHAKQHYEQTGYPLSVKLGTISAEGEADVYSYPEDDMIEDPDLEKHLLHFGINLQGMKKTEKSIAELELDQNISFEFSRIQEKGQELTPLHGPGLTGIENLGNSCYLSSVMQTLFSVPAFQQRFFSAVNKEAVYRSAANPPQDFEAQMVKLAHGLLSGEYATPISDRKEKEKEGSEKEFAEPNQIGIAPRMFKGLVGKDHPEFSTMRQQDALEFFQHMLTLISRHERSRGGSSAQNDPVKTFEYLQEERIRCPNTDMVKYKYETNNVLSLNIPLELATNMAEVHASEQKRKGLSKEELLKEEPVRPHVSLEACLKAFAQPEEIPSFYSTGARSRVTAHKTTRLGTFPDVLVIVAKRFITDSSWTPKKLEVDLEVPDDIDVSFLRGNGLQPNEKELPEDAAAGGAVQQGPTADEGVVSQLMDMGFPRVRSVKAAINTNNQGAEQAMNWLLEHMDDPDIDVEPAPAAAAPAQGGAKPAAPVNEEAVENLTAMGFTRAQVIKALSNTDNNVERAADWLFSHPDELDTMDTEPTGAAAGGAAAPAAAAAKNPKEGLHDGNGKYKLLGFISHIGSSTSSGHYVCHIKKDGKWVLFNDRKVASSKDPPREMAYLYFFQRV